MASDNALASSDTPVTGKISSVLNGAVDSVKNAATLTIPAQINGKEIQLHDTFDVISPSTGKLLHHCSSVSVADAISAVEAAQQAFLTWRNTTPATRRDLLLKTADVVERRAEELGRYMVEETGAPDAFASGFNLPVSVDGLRDIAGRVSSIVGSVPATGDPGKSAIVFKEPYGVILGIAPWNAPFILGFRAIAYAIAAGNTAVLKAPELSPRCSWAIGDCFREAGLPAGVLNVIAHKPSSAAAVTKALIEHPFVRKINFTGSTAVGRIIAELAGKNLKPVLLELGGKAPAIVWKDADLKLAAQECIVGAFLHSGQICMSTERIIVHRSIAARFEELLKESLPAIFAEPGVLINKAGVQKNKKLLRDALAKGATLLNGDVDTQESSETRMAPIIVKGISTNMDIYQTESFGPTVSLFEVDSEDEAVRLANDCEYGLSAAVFTEDLRTGFRIAKGIESGAVHINGMTVHDEPGLPHGGVKNSGYGRFGASGLEEWLRTKTVTFKT